MHADAVLKCAQCLAIGGLCIVFGQYLLTYADPRRDDPLKFRNATFIRRDQVPGWLYRFLTFSNATEDSIGTITATNVTMGVLSVALGITFVLFGLYELVRALI